MKTEIYKTIGITLISTIFYIVFTSAVFYDQFRERIFYGHIGSFYPYFFSLGALLIGMAAILVYRMTNYGHSSLVILTVAIALSGFSYLIGFLNFDPTGTINFRQTRLFQLQVLSQTISIFLLYLHYELNIRLEPRPLSVSLVTLSLTPYSLLNVFYLTTNNYPEGDNFRFFELITLSILQLGAISIFVWLFINGLKVTEYFVEYGSKAKKYALIQLSGVTLILIGVILQFVESITPLDVWHTPLNAMAISLIATPYFINPKVMLFAPAKIRFYGIVDSAGRTMYHKAISEEFLEQEREGSTADLFGGLTLAFSNIGAEVAKSSQAADSMIFGDRAILIEYMDPYYFIAIADSASYFLEREIHEYLKELKSEWPSPPEDGSAIPEDTFNVLNTKFFPTFLR